MADEPAGRTSLGVLHEILNNLGDSNQYHYVVEALEALKDLLGEGGIGEAVSEWLAAHPEATTTVQNGSITLLKLANDVKSAINGKAESSDLQTLADNLEALAQTVAEKADASDLDDKADIDGYYSQLTAGLAENLIGRGDAVPAEYLYRTAGGTADIEDGIATIDCIKGNTLVWNQLVQLNDYYTQVVGINLTIDPTTGYIAINGTATASGGRNSYVATNIPLKKDHKYLILDTLNYAATGNAATWVFSDVSGAHTFIVTIPVNQIFTYSGDDVTCWMGKNYTTGNTYNCSGYVSMYDLTLMFGSGNEPATVAEFEAMYPLPYYPYSAPKLLPVDMRGVETVGFNLWDEEWEVGSIGSAGNITDATKIRSKNYIPVFPGQTYYVKSPNTLTFYGYDAQKNTITYEFNGYTTIGKTNATLTIPSGVHYLRFYMTGTTYDGDICINLSWSGYRNGEYEECWSAERPIDTSRFFPTGLKKAGDKADALYADHYDTVIGSVDLGTLRWLSATASDVTYFYADFSSVSGTPLPKLPATNSDVANIKCGLYKTLKNAMVVAEDKAMSLASNAARVFIHDSAYTDAATFKAAMSGVVLYYELATPTTTEIDPPLNLSYKVSDFGTERIMVDETADAPQSAPVPMEVEYGINAIDTIRRLPKEYQSHKSMGQLTAALESSLGVDITETWDETEQRYEYEIGSLEIGTDNIEDGAVTDAKLAQTGGVLSKVQTLDGYFVGSTNVFNQADPDLVENVELKNDGTTAAKTGYFASGYIPVQAGATICAHYPTGTYGSASSLVLYDDNKTRIGYAAGSNVARLQDGNGHSYIKYTFASDTPAKYFRCTGSIIGYPYYMYVYANEMPSAYEPYIPNTRLSDSVKVAFANVTDVSVSKSDTDFIKSNPKNLVDLSAMVQGVVANSSTSGAVDASATNWVTTDYIPVSPGKTYSLYVMLGAYYGAGYLGIPYYNKDKVYLGRVIPNGGRVNVGVLDSITIPSDNTIAYIRTSYPLAKKTNHKQWYSTMVVEGSAWVGDAYIPYDGVERLQGAGLSYEHSQPMNCLFGKLALWNGDSICAADNDPNGGWPLTIAAANGMQAKNYGVAGGTIAENAGANVHSVSATLDGMLSDFPNADYIVIEGGTNDADLLGDAGIGTFDADDFTDAYINGLDKTTFSGALESVLYRLVTVMKGRHIGYIIPQKMGHTEVLVARRRTYFDRAIAICAKWGVPYLDLWNDYYFNWRLSTHWDQTKTSEENNAANNLYRDGQHLTDRGYAVQSPVIAEWMKTL